MHSLLGSSTPVVTAICRRQQWTTWCMSCPSALAIERHLITAFFTNLPGCQFRQNKFGLSGPRVAYRQTVPQCLHGDGAANVLLHFARPFKSCRAAEPSLRALTEVHARPTEYASGEPGLTVVLSAENAAADSASPGLSAAAASGCQVSCAGRKNAVKERLLLCVLSKAPLQRVPAHP